MYSPSPARSAIRAFTLIELSIVLVIIALMLGGLMVGSSMLRQSQMQSLISDYSKYNTAVSQFNQQYGGLPGDLLDATNYWGDDNAVCADAAVTNGTPGTCNGNGSNKMGDGAEPYRAWQQLVLANYLSGSFTGVASGGGAVPEVNVPKSRANNSGWSFGYKDATSANATQYDQALNNFLALGAPISGDITKGASLTPSEAWQIDTKMDNGLPATGRVVTLKPASLATCALNPDSPTDTNDGNDTYNRTYGKKSCSLNMALTIK